MEPVVFIAAADVDARGGSISMVILDDWVDDRSKDNHDRQLAAANW